MSDWSQYLQNPQGVLVKKYMFDVLQEKFGKHQEIIERLTNSLQTEKDVQAYCGLVADIYEIAFTKAMKDCQEQLKTFGYQVNMVSPKNQD